MPFQARRTVSLDKRFILSLRLNPGIVVKLNIPPKEVRTNSAESGLPFSAFPLTCSSLSFAQNPHNCFKLQAQPMPGLPKHKIFAISDSALTIDFGNFIDESINQQVISLFRQLQDSPVTGMIEAVPAYSSLTIYYDLFQLRKSIPAGTTVYDWMSGQLQEKLEPPSAITKEETRLITIPVCYDIEFAPDIEALASQKNIAVEEVIHIHSSGKYRVYMLGFLPGFCYLGEVDEKIVVGRKPQPQPVAAGSVGIAGRQTGIYPLASPGGWQIIGRTPLKLFDAQKEQPALLMAGDRIRFTSITKNEFASY
jgi:inhibitor of KinA